MSSVDPRSRENRPRRGRPSKGDKVSLRVRVPRNLAVPFLQDATRAEISHSDQMAEILHVLRQRPLYLHHRAKVRCRFGLAYAGRTTATTFPKMMASSAGIGW
jgi:epoxyqueuosine reductase QueG